MSWLSRVKRPRYQSTTICFHINDIDEPVLHNLSGLWRDEALLGVLEALVQEYYHPDTFEPFCEILWQDGEETWGEELDLVLHLRRG